jgi:hypothetical protein
LVSLSVWREKRRFELPRQARDKHEGNWKKKEKEKEKKKEEEK